MLLMSVLLLWLSQGLGNICLKKITNYRFILLFHICCICILSNIIQYLSKNNSIWSIWISSESLVDVIVKTVAAVGATLRLKRSLRCVSMIRHENVMALWLLKTHGFSFRLNKFTAFSLKTSNSTFGFVCSSRRYAWALPI